MGLLDFLFSGKKATVSAQPSSQVTSKRDVTFLDNFIEIPSLGFLVNLKGRAPASGLYVGAIAMSKIIEVVIVTVVTAGMSYTTPPKIPLQCKAEWSARIQAALLITAISLLKTGISGAR
jgi:hypothetical protein